MFLIGYTRPGMSFSPNISLKSISIFLQIAVIGMSLMPFSKGFSLLSPTISITLKIHEIITLKGMVSQTKAFPNFSNSPINPNGSSIAKIQTNNSLKRHTALGKGSFLFVRKHLAGRISP